ncbi:hypothetical protein C8Q75DRAFT_237160 [Abortiporus biennis]|nr:hypothetical protein C8Q75DRAFT_237160 [Abortiporus biennis]
MTSAVTTTRSVAFLLTLVRLYYRAQRHHLGWDDAWAAFALVCVIFMCAGGWIGTSEPGIGPIVQSPHIRMVGYYMNSIGFTCVVWSSRLSILCTLMRIIPSMMRLRDCTRVFAGFFITSWSIIIFMKIYLCERHPDWKQLTHVNCPFPHSVAIVEIITDCISDIFLIVAPLRLLWGITMPKAQHRLLTAIFSSNILTTIISVIHDAEVINPNFTTVGILAPIQAAVALIVCNLSVLVTWAFRVIRRHNEEDEDEGTPHYTITTLNISLSVTRSRFPPSNDDYDSSNAALERQQEQQRQKHQYHYQHHHQDGGYLSTNSNIDTGADTSDKRNNTLASMESFPRKYCHPEFPT